MIQYLTQDPKAKSIPIFATSEESFERDSKKWDIVWRSFAKEMGFQGKSRTLCCMPHGGFVSHVMYGASTNPFEKAWDAAFLAKNLVPQNTYHFENIDVSEEMAVAWVLASYHFQVDQNKSKAIPTLVIPEYLNLEAIKATVEAITLIRTLINRPANLLTPEDLSKEARIVANQHKAHFKEIVGEDLIKENYPLIYAVGKAAATPPRFIEISWGNPEHFHLALIGKGITFDTGGLHIKTGNYMNLMKKDMGGAAHALGLAHWIMDQKLPIHLTLCLPIAENAIAGNAMRPGDIVYARNGLSVAIEDTDAEGRLILADALARAVELNPDLMIDFATLTGAARIALGTDLPALFTNQDDYRAQLMDLGFTHHDPLWPLPLWEGYASSLKSDVADLQNIAPSSYGGAITAALFLEKFVSKTPWIHMDLMAWNVKDRPGRPIGGEAQTFRTFCAFIKGLCC
jgi:leucyl aminopeptidase